MSPTARLLLPAALAGTVLAVVPAQATPCVTNDTVHACVTVLGGAGEIACVSAAADPSEHTVDDVIGAYLCYADFGGGTGVHSCVFWGRRQFLCTR